MGIYQKIVRYFSLVEVALALGIVGFGIAGIMAIFPVAINANRDAVGDTYAADTAEFLVVYLSMLAQNTTPPWNPGVDSPFVIPSNNFPVPDAQPEKNPTGGWEDLVDDVNPVIDLGPPEVRVADNIQKHQSVSGVYRIMQGADLGGANPRLDFDAMARIWTVPITVRVDGETKSISQGIGVGVNVELSWPAGVPHANRTRRNYYFEILNSN